MTIRSLPISLIELFMLLASMLREHGTQRPSVFEILNHVHTLRGTKSRFTYSLPPRQPPLSPRTATSAPLQTLSPNIMSTSSANPLDDLVTYKPRQSPAKNAGVEAREKVLEAKAIECIFRLQSRRGSGLRRRRSGSGGLAMRLKLEWFR